MDMNEYERVCSVSCNGSGRSIHFDVSAYRSDINVIDEKSFEASFLDVALYNECGSDGRLTEIKEEKAPDGNVGRSIAFKHNFILQTHTCGIAGQNFLQRRQS